MANKKNSRIYKEGVADVFSLVTKQAGSACEKDILKGNC